MESNLASLLVHLGRWLWVDDGDIGSTSALGVLDNGAGLLAVRLLFADGLVWEGVVELKLAVELDRDLELGDGESLDVLGGNPWAVLLFGRDLSGGALLVEGSREESVALESTERVLAVEPVELEAGVLLKLALGELEPVESTVLFWHADLWGLNWALEWGGVMPVDTLMYVSAGRLPN